MSLDTENHIAKLSKEYGVVDVITCGSSLKFCIVAEGYANQYPRFGPTMEWDTAAGHVIVKEAGGEVKDAMTGNVLQYNKENLLNNYFIVCGAVATRENN